MSYCRWSSMDGACDLYIYGDVSGGWTIHVANNRTTRSFSGALADLQDAAGRTETDLKDWLEVGERCRVLIDLPHAGKTFNLSTPGECADRVEELIALGYIVPDGVVQELRNEQKELED